MKTRLFAALGLVAVLAVSAWAADIKLEGIKCVVNPKAAAKEANAADYKGGKVFFCCQNCPKAFAEDPAKFAVKANEQLIATGQAVQKACPISGGKLDASTGIKVDGLDVAFCCDKCKGKVEAATPAEAADLVFADKPFEKAFKVETK